MFFVSVVIPVFNQKDCVLKNISSWLEQSYPSDKYEIIIVDDGSTDGLKERIDGLVSNGVSCRYFLQFHQGPAAARNFGIKQSCGEIVAFTNADCAFSVDWVKEIVVGYEDDNVAGIGGTVSPVVSDSLVSRYCAHVRMNECPGSFQGKIEYLITANASFRKECLLEVGGFNERYRSACGEDVDLSYRLIKRGYVLIYNKKAIVFDPHKKNLSELLNTFFRYGKGEAYLILTRISQNEPMLLDGLAWFSLFLRGAFNVIIILFKMVFSFLKYPSQFLHYIKEGLGWNKSLVFAGFDYLKNNAFQYGRIFGYILVICKKF